MKNRTIIYSGLLVCLALAGCKDTDDLSATTAPLSDRIIRVGGIGADELVAHVSKTRSPEETPDEGGAVDESAVVRTDAENVEWLRGPLFDGLDITYGLASDRTTSRVAVLKLLGDETNGIKYVVDTDEDETKTAEYSFMFRNDSSGEITSSPAIWHDNGPHFFEGVYTPDDIRYDADTKTVSAVYGTGGTAPSLDTDQHVDTTNVTTGKLGNYTLLSHYLGMPSNFTLNATVARVKLPFRHRLARVLAYILIDPELGDTVKLAGYMTDGTKTEPREDASTTSIKFCNVDVLAGVKDTYNESKQHHTFNPKWTTARKVTPHFVGERGSYDDSQMEVLDANHFIAYYNKDKGTYIYPTDREWATIYARGDSYFDENDESTDKKYTRTRYGTVPVYDLIVRPTYTSLDNVMYDEEGVSVEATQTELFMNQNQIDFELTLNNGLHYTKNFPFDLDANYQTVVYLHISRERVDYSSSGNEIWQEARGYDEYYGVNNQNGNTLSQAGSSWQRAYTNKEQNYNVTDGHQYQWDTEDRYAQYVTDEKWIEMLREAHEGGLHHGDYFILDHDIRIPAAAFPDNFVFTGHLDGMDHNIIIVDSVYTKVTHPVTYVTYVQNEAKTVTKYFKPSDIYDWMTDEPMELIWAGVDFYEQVIDEEENIRYSLIDDIYAYDSCYAYYINPMTEEYTRLNFYMRDYSTTVSESLPVKEKPYWLFKGLDGAYSTPQESNLYADWEANVHKEGDNWVPYTNGTDGWRGEMMNVNFRIDTASGCTVFKPGTVWGTDITGYLHNCWVNSTYSGTPPKWSGTPIQNYTPAIPVY